MKRPSLTAAFAFVIVAGLSLEVGVASKTSIKPEDPLEVSDLVVQGVVQKVEPGRFTYPTHPPDSLRFDSVKVSMSVQKVLRGNWSAKTITIVVLHDSDAFEVGRDYTVCAYWYPIKNSYVTTPWIGFYGKGDGHWIRRLAPDNDVEPDTLSQADVVARIDKGSLRSVTRRADLVVAGKVIAMDDSVYATANGWHGRVMHYTLQVGEVLKGKVDRKQVMFVIPGSPETPLGRRPTPEIAVGEEWLLFLQSSKLGYYPFAWRNSLLRIENDKLIYNSTVIYPESRSRATQLVRQEAQREKE
jgi:hypothetical protein